MNEEEALALYKRVWSSCRDSTATAAVLQAVATGSLEAAIRENTDVIREQARFMRDSIDALNRRK